MIRPISFGGRERVEIIKEKRTFHKQDVAKLNALLAIKPQDILYAYP